MTGKFLMDAIGDAKDSYVLEAEQLRPAQLRRVKRSPWKILLAAALIPLLMITAYASDFMNIKTLCSGAVHYTGSSFRQMDKAMERAGFRMDVKETFENGYTFQKVTVQDTRALDEDNREVLKYREIYVEYRNSAGNRIPLIAEPVLEEIPQTDRPADQTRDIGGVTASYHLDHYKFVPADYKLTEADRIWEQQPGNNISYGSDTVEEKNVSFLTWEKEGIGYLLMDTESAETPDTLFAMASELINP